MKKFMMLFVLLALQFRGECQAQFIPASITDAMQRDLSNDSSLSDFTVYLIAAWVNTRHGVTVEGVDYPVSLEKGQMLYLLVKTCGSESLDRVYANADFSGSYLKSLRLKQAYLRGAYLKNSVMRGSWLHDAILSDANLDGCDLGGAVLTGCDLSGARLTGSTVTEAQLRTAKQ